MRDRLNEITERIETAFHLTAEISARGTELDALAALRQELRLAHKTASAALEGLETEGTNG